MSPTVIFDCDGVLADTELHGHLPAFNEMFAEVGLPLRWSAEEYVSLLAIGGGKERLRAALGPELRARGLDDDAQTSLIAQWHALKSKRYVERVAAGLLPPRAGVRRLVAELIDRGWGLAVASTSAESSVRAVLDHAVGTEIARHFHVFAGEAVVHKKPAPDIYLLAMETLGADRQETVVVEDSRTGLTAALAAGLATVVTVNASTADDDLSGAALVVTSLGDPPDEPARVVHNPLGLEVQGLVDTALLHQIVTSGPVGRDVVDAFPR